MKRHGRKGSQWRDRMFGVIRDRDGSICAKCSVPHKSFWVSHGRGRSHEGWAFSWIFQRSNLEMDHILPLSEGGDNESDNLWLLCIDCHKKKTSAERSARLKKLFAEWRESQAA